MEIRGFVVRDRDGYEWHGERLRPKNHEILRDWQEKYGNDFYRADTNLRLYSQKVKDDPILAGYTSFSARPDCFEAYDPFVKQSALFEIAHRLYAGSNRKDDGRSQVVEFANKWGDIHDSPDANGLTLAEWQHLLSAVVAITIRLPSASKISSTRLPNFAAEIARVTAMTQLRYDIQATGSGLRSTATCVGLHSCLLVQAAEACVNKWVIRNCESCGAPIAPNDNREDRIYCDNACRKRAFRKRIKIANAMRAAGKTLREISSATGSDIDTIKNWLSQGDK